jgi:hypothetical protein
MFIRDGRKEKRLEYFARNPATVLLVDHSRVSEQLNPNNTVIVEPMSEFQDRRRRAEEAGQPRPSDTACLGIKALVTRVREDAAAYGAVSVPRALAKLRHEAAVAGFATDTAGLYQYLMSAAEAEVEAERQRREGGLGGAIRRLVEASPFLRGRVTLTEAASVRPFRDPADDTAEDSLVAHRYHTFAARVFMPQSAQQQQ